MVLLNELDVTKAQKAIPVISVMFVTNESKAYPTVETMSSQISIQDHSTYAYRLPEGDSAENYQVGDLILIWQGRADPSLVMVVDVTNAKEDFAYSKREIAIFGSVTANDSLKGAFAEFIRKRKDEQAATQAKKSLENFLNAQLKDQAIAMLRDKGAPEEVIAETIASIETWNLSAKEVMAMVNKYQIK